jgi:hypothetical protein
MRTLVLFLLLRNTQGIRVFLELCRPPSVGLGLTVAAAFCVASCGAETTAPEDMPWLKDLIRGLEAEPVRNPPASVTEYRYEGALVYYVPPACCDIFSDLYDHEGRLMCHPDGGFTGRGDGQCPDFLKERLSGRVIWQDTRGRL